MKKLFFLSAATIFFLVGLYIVQINSLTAQAYATTSLKKELITLQETNKNLQSNVVKSFSVQNVATLASQLNFQKVDQVSYVQVLVGSVAKRSTNNE